MSTHSAKILHRSLDLLQLWVLDCRRVDFTATCSFLNTLENFLNTEVSSGNRQARVSGCCDPDPLGSSPDR